MISVIICHHKGNLIQDALRTLSLSEGVEFEIIVATSVFGAQFPACRTIFLNGPPTYKRNKATLFAHGEYLAFFDDDVIVDKDCLREQFKLMWNSSVGMVFGKLKNMEFKDRFDEAGSFLTPTGFLWARAESGIIDKGQYEKVESILAGKSASCMIKRKVFHQVGGFDESFGILGEETDLAWRVWLKGYQVLWAPQSLAYHAFNTRFKPPDFYTNERVYFNGCRNYIVMLLKNLGKENLWIVPVHTLAWFLTAFGMFLRGKWSAGWNILRGIFYVLDNLKSIVRKRRWIQQTRVIRDKELFQIVLKKPGFSYYFKRLLRYVKTGLHG